MGSNHANWLTDTMSNRPFIVGALFLGTYFVPFLIFVGVALAYLFKNRPEEDWETSHFLYLIRTFWIAIAAILVGAVFAIGLISFFPSLDDPSLPIAIVLVIGGGLILAYSGVRIVLSLMKSAAKIPIANPRAWLF